MNSRIFAAALMAASALASGAAQAQVDKGLYAPAPPANSAFVRVLNAKADGSPVDGQLGAVKYAPVTSGSASTYRAIKAGALKARVGAAAPAVNVQAGRFYSLVVTGAKGAEKVAVVQDPTLESKAKSLITLYNLTPRAGVELRTGDAKTAVTSPVKSGGVGSRSVNAARTGFAVVSAGKVLATVPVQTVGRGAAYSVIVTEAGGVVRANWAPSITRN